MGVGVEAGGREADRWGTGETTGRGEVEGMGAGAAGGDEMEAEAAGGDEMEAERKKSSGRSSHDDETAAGDGEAKGFVAPPGSAIREIGGERDKKGRSGQEGTQCRQQRRLARIYVRQCRLGAVRSVVCRRVVRSRFAAHAALVGRLHVWRKRTRRQVTNKEPHADHNHIQIYTVNLLHIMVIIH